MGGILCLLYDALRIFRKIFPPSTLRLFIEDTVFSLFSGIISFVFLLSVTNGEIRSFVLLGIGMGFLITRLTVSVLMLKIFVAILIPVKSVFRLLKAKFYNWFDSLVCNIGKFIKKHLKRCKKLLKTATDLLYTK